MVVLDQDPIALDETSSLGISSHSNSTTISYDNAHNIVPIKAKLPVMIHAMLVSHSLHVPSKLKMCEVHSHHLSTWKKNGRIRWEEMSIIIKQINTMIKHKM